MQTFILGVADVPYAARAGGSTGDVAEMIEKKYHVMAFFFERHKSEIQAAMVDAVAGSIETMLMGGPARSVNFDTATDKIKTLFQYFIDNREMDFRVGGVPTKASLRGVNHRMKHPYAKRASRPSFQDTGLMESAFKAWVKE